MTEVRLRGFSNIRQCRSYPSVSIGISNKWETVAVAEKLFWNCGLDVTTGSIKYRASMFIKKVTPYHVTPCNFLLLFYSSIYSVYSWVFLINLMKTGIGQSKHWLETENKHIRQMSFAKNVIPFKRPCWTLTYLHRRKSRQYTVKSSNYGRRWQKAGAPNENIVQNHLNIALLTKFSI